ncbi:related to transthyretin-like protein pucM [Cephalotrichum gorgonifer]|uniref:5-hydroxyisourate hydrolase n=1 Tax=Cephalotrichum gorgonifer TaxID=2041049 RepID=A0AAE8MQL6_9PEZI|nr:related to transthyretin-like protein pucM [Cephalotrichum gorgonifer]
MATKDRITCHVLNTQTGRPAASVQVRLESLSTSTPRTFESRTDDDGRVKAWLPYSGARSSGEVPLYTLDDVIAELDDGGKGSRWVLTFDTGAYFGEGNTFFPEVAVTFTMGEGHHHVPLLLAPYSYTTYRGS